MGRCGNCNFFGDQDRHYCYPFMISDDGEHKIWAQSEEDAALKYITSKNEEGDNNLIGKPFEIKVDGTTYKVLVSAEIYYHAETGVIGNRPYWLTELNNIDSTGNGG